MLSYVAESLNLDCLQIRRYDNVPAHKKALLAFIVLVQSYQIDDFVESAILRYQASYLCYRN